MSKAWHIIYRATDEDRERLERSARAFARRHGIRLYADASAVDAVENEIYPAWSLRENARYLRRLWHQCAARALRHSAATGIAHDYVGYSA